MSIHNWMACPKSKSMTPEEIRTAVGHLEKAKVEFDEIRLKSHLRKFMRSVFGEAHAGAGLRDGIELLSRSIETARNNGSITDAVRESFNESVVSIENKAPFYSSRLHDLRICSRAGQVRLVSSATQTTPFRNQQFSLYT